MPCHDIPVDLGERGYSIHLADNPEQAWSEPLRGLVPDRQVAVITDHNVNRLHGEALAAVLHRVGVPEPVWLTVEPGEKSKDQSVLWSLYTKLLEAEFRRDGVILGFGGGVVGDLSGFAAATLHRGVDFVQIPTSLLAMVDSAIGGKVGINHSVGKNLVGAFHQPKSVLVNTQVLGTLNKREVSCGFAEIIKYGVIAGSDLFEEVSALSNACEHTTSRQVLDIIATSARIKADVVVRDEHEGGLRMILNFGHTLGHAIEATSGYGNWSHGEAVAVGMVMAARFGADLGITPAGVEPALVKCCEVHHLPTALLDSDVEALMTAVRHDKKVRGDVVKFVFARSLGEAVVESVSFDQLAKWLASDAN